MTEITEQPTTTTNDEQQPETKKRKEKPQLPSVSYLLQNGLDKDPNEKPETFLQSLVLPGILFLVFVLSLVVFHYVTSAMPRRINPNAKFQQKWNKLNQDL